MNYPRTPNRLKRNGLGRTVPAVVIAITLMVFASALGLITVHLRGVIRQQIVQQDGEVLYAASIMQPADVLGAGNNSVEERLPALLEASKLRGVIAVRLYNPNGQFVASFPGGLKEGTVANDDVAALRAGATVSHYLPQANLSEVFPKFQKARFPLLQALVPIGGGTNFVGVAEFLLDGQNTELAFANLDRDLGKHAIGFFFVGTLVITAALLWAFQKLEKANKLLISRTEDLLKANQELEMAAKTSAIGAVAAHLLHGLKNPLFGLQTFVSSGGHTAQPPASDWEIAQQSAKRMQMMINDIVRILNEEQTSSNYEISIQEVAGLVESKFRQEAQRTQKNIVVETLAKGMLENRTANLISLILSNLVQNALQALPAGGTVWLRAVEENGEVAFDVRDNGPGLDEAAIGRLFKPCHSSKAGGSGIGLAISKQLAQHVGADLRLVETSSKGAIFKLALPNGILIREATEDSALASKES